MTTRTAPDQLDTLRRAIRILASWIQREDSRVTSSTARNEACWIAAAHTMAAYLQAPRLGSLIGLNRPLRRSFWLLWVNAQKHAQAEADAARAA
jgi:hypothetical protein